MDVAKRYSCFQLQSFLRWIASEEAFAGNINDLKDEGTGKLIELTIRYENFEWSFSCGRGDLDGHETSSEEFRQPHYHFQMRVNKQAFIRFGDFHIPLSYDDVLYLEAQRVDPNLIKEHFTGGHGMNDVINDDTVEKIIMAPKSGGKEDEAPIKIELAVNRG